MTEHGLTELGDEISERLSQSLYDSDPEAWARIYTPDGSGKTRTYTAEDGWFVDYSTERVRGGPHDGKFAVLAYRPVGPGSRSGDLRKISEWTRVYFRGFAKRRSAKRRALEIYFQHSPRRRGSLTAKEAAARFV